jgi:hypothetical protein
MREITPGRLWASVFGLWAILLSGVFATFVGSPGVIQAIRLGSLLESKQLQVTQMQADLRKLQTEASLIERSRVAQQREIRRVLGYTAPDELIFDFTASELN